MSRRCTSPVAGPVALSSNSRCPWSAAPKPLLMVPTDVVLGTPS